MSKMLKTFYIFLCCYFWQVLADIEIAQSLKVESEKVKKEMVEMVPDPIDQNYRSLECSLTLMDKKSEEFKVFLVLYKSYTCYTFWVF